MIVAIIQARMGSTRLPGKVLMQINKVPSIIFQIERIKKSKKIDKIVVATTLNHEDNVIEDLCLEAGIECYRGSSLDVLDRYYCAAKLYEAKNIVRLTADCPFTDPKLIDKLISLHEKSGAAYSSNTVPPDKSFWPDGSDIEVFSFNALSIAHNKSKDLSEREHVTFYLWKNKKFTFNRVQLENDEDGSKYRFTVDYPEDFQVIQELVKLFEQKKIFGHIGEIVQLLKENPQIVDMNKKYYFGMGWDK